MPINGNAAGVSVTRARPTPEQRLRESLQGQTIETVTIDGDTLTITTSNGYELALTVDGGIDGIMQESI